MPASTSLGVVKAPIDWSQAPKAETDFRHTSWSPSRSRMARRTRQNHCPQLVWHEFKLVWHRPSLRIIEPGKSHHLHAQLSSTSNRLTQMRCEHPGRVSTWCVDDAGEQHLDTCKPRCAQGGTCQKLLFCAPWPRMFGQGFRSHDPFDLGRPSSAFASVSGDDSGRQQAEEVLQLAVEKEVGRERVLSRWVHSHSAGASAQPSASISAAISLTCARPRSFTLVYYVGMQHNGTQATTAYSTAFGLYALSADAAMERSV